MQTMIEILGGGAPENKLLVGKKIGFTMAEVLITLGIIGIVAAMTLPSLINNKKNKELETAFKKNYSVISQALNMYYAQNGERLTPENVKNIRLKTILMDYMKVLHDCGMGSYDSEACIPNYGENHEDNPKIYKTFNGKTEMNLRMFDDGQFVLNDGSLILIENYFSKPGTVYISVDVNGHLKNPNRLGHDLFMFQLDSKGNLIPMGAKGTDYYDENDAYCSSMSTNNMNGAACTIKAINEKDYFTKLH